jgi:hypothetical protein
VPDSEFYSPLQSDLFSEIPPVVPYAEHPPYGGNATAPPYGRHGKTPQIVLLSLRPQIEVRAKRPPASPCFRGLPTEKVSPTVEIPKHPSTEPRQPDNSAGTANSLWVKTILFLQVNFRGSLICI